MKNALRVLIKTKLQSISVRFICRSNQIDFGDWESIFRMLELTNTASEQTCLKETMAVYNRQYISAKLYNLARRIRDKDSCIIRNKLADMLYKATSNMASH